ncbi:MAG: hypothetical protein JEZ06_10925 [Anaerolineaceae bacterium]|nr:hypothetical protein [Anaerolineaceae bacterium]
MKNLPSNPINIAQALFYLNAVIWLLFGVTSLMWLSNSDPGQLIVFATVAIMMFGNAAAMLVSGWMLQKRIKLFIYLL